MLPVWFQEWGPLPPQRLLTHFCPVHLREPRGFRGSKWLCQLTSVHSFGKVGRFHLPLHHVPSHKIYVLPAATTPMKISKILFARSFRYISNTPTHIFRRFYFVK